MKIYKKVIFNVSEELYNKINIEKSKCAKYKEDILDDGMIHLKKICI